MKTILVPLDGSALAEQVLPHVRALAPLLSANVHLLHVVSEADRYHLLFDDPQGLGESGRPLGPDREWEVLRKNSETYLQEQVEKLGAFGLDADFEVRLGSPPELIAEASDRDGICLVAMATHGYSGLRRWALGSVTDKVLHAAKTPVMVVRGAEQPIAGERAIRRIMLPLDGSELARKAIPLASELAISARAELLLFTVAVPPLMEAPETMAALGPYDEAVAKARDRLVEELGPYAEQLKQHEIKVTPLALTGMVAEAIVDEAARTRTNLIVMATHGAAGLRRWAMGSVADKVLHATTTPLILVNAHE